ncbi:MAG: GTPase ObgE [bacterium TMED6]|nr:MAG: GTPase ObgE [bacterium TMED6]|tara:strand:+ start:3216 stop:4193 length:978 start_codon:yes stop_codon:yes gene_type:complete
MRFIDETTIRVKAGDGGHGCIAFLREKFRPQGGPCGGDGGKGGDIVFTSDKQLATLQDLPNNHHYKANRGDHGKGKNCHGKNGDDFIIKVPLGTIVKNSETEQIIHDFKNNNENFVIAKGGNGGFGNARFKTRNNVAPKVANDGAIGEELSLSLELKVLADVGLVGFPNAGKSTLISKVSNSKPKISDYPFTTLQPNLGIVKYGNYKSFVMADIPGLVEGASKGKGLGSQFLRHIERTKVLVFIIDANSDDIENDFQTLNNELINHKLELNSLPKILLISKVDSILEEDLKLKKLPTDIEIIKISSISGKNLENAIKSIAYLVES